MASLFTETKIVLPWAHTNARKNNAYFFDGFGESIVGHYLKNKQFFEKRVFIQNQCLLFGANLKCQTE